MAYDEGTSAVGVIGVGPPAAATSAHGFPTGATCPGAATRQPTPPTSLLVTPSTMLGNVVPLTCRETTEPGWLRCVRYGTAPLPPAAGEDAPASTWDLGDDRLTSLLPEAF